MSHTEENTIKEWLVNTSQVNVQKVNAMCIATTLSIKRKAPYLTFLWRSLSFGEIMAIVPELLRIFLLVVHANSVTSPTTVLTLRFAVLRNLR